MKFEVGQILNSKGRGIFGRLIRWRNSFIYGRRHNWAHSAIISGVEKERILVYEAISKGFVATYYEEAWLRRKIDEGFFIVGETEIPLKDVKNNADNYLGRGYGFLDIVHITIFWIFGTKAKFLFTGAQNLICSEAVARIIYDASEKEINFEKEFEIPYDLIEPMHLFLSKQIKWQKV